VQIGVDRGVLVDRQIAVFQGDVRALHNDLKNNQKMMVRQLERLMTNQVAGGPLAAQSTQLNSDYPPFILARFGVLPCHGAVVCVVPKHNFCSVLELDALITETSETTNLIDMAERPRRLQSPRIILESRTSLRG
jgi:hypothetical protein